jgi:hypothetical protein
MARLLFDGKKRSKVIPLLCDVWAQDGTDMEAAAIAGISKSALYRFLKHSPKITELRGALKAKTFVSCRRTVLAAIKAGNAELALKYLERKSRDEFSLKQEVVNSGDIIKKIVFVDAPKPKPKPKTKTKKRR